MKKKVLIVLPTLPFPLFAGGNQAMFNSFNSVKEDVDVFISYSVPFYKNREGDRKKMESFCKGINIKPFVYNPLKGFHNFVLWLFFRITILLKMKKKNFDYFCSQMPQLFSVQSKEYADFINDLICKYKIDIVQMEMCSTLSHVLTLQSNVKKIFVHHEINYVVNGLRVHKMGESATRLANVELAKILEIGLLNKCDGIISLSEIDKQKLIMQGVRTPVYSSFAVVNTSTNNANPNRLYNELSFVGPAFHSPNFLGLLWFLENCWADILERDSTYVLKIIGNWPKDKRIELLKKYKNVHFLGFVPNLADALNNTIMIVPINVGSGIRMKILEAAGLGVPFVSTSIGAEGLPFENDVDFFKADTPEEFINAIFKLQDASLREKFARHANEIVRENFSIKALRKNRLSIYDSVLNEKKY